MTMRRLPTFINTYKHANIHTYARICKHIKIHTYIYAYINAGRLSTIHTCGMIQTCVGEIEDNSIEESQRRWQYVESCSIDLSYTEIRRKI